MRYSRQRELVLDTVRQNPRHLTADEIYTILKVGNPELSLGTVYRNLSTLAAAGEIKKLSMPGQGDRFDGNVQDHCHFYCHSCRRVLDLETDILELITERVTDATKVKITGKHLLFEGTCADCNEDTV